MDSIYTIAACTNKWARFRDWQDDQFFSAMSTTANFIIYAGLPRGRNVINMKYATLSLSGKK